MTEAKQCAGKECVTLDLLKKKMDEFAKERDWEKYHSPRNLLLALTVGDGLIIDFVLGLVRILVLKFGVGEIGELSEIFQWKGEVPKGLPDWEDEEKVHLGEELSDVLLYLIRLSDMCGIDLNKAALRKIELNALKYPVNICRGSSDRDDDVENSK
ncbi:hypothetical protein OROMI_015447 [Orobanche minor]